LNGYLLEVSREDYLEHYKKVNRQDYIRKEARRVGQISLESMTSIADESIRGLYEDVAEEAITEMMNEYLHKAIAVLDADDQMLIWLLYFDEQTEHHCAEIFGVNQSTINRRRNRILEKLRNILEA
jgi:RNA polymerase sigma factor (sigma-70 family)